MIALLPISLGGSSQHAKYNVMQAARVRSEDEDLLLLFFHKYILSRMCEVKNGNKYVSFQMV